MGSHRTLTLALLSLLGWTLISAFNLDTDNVIRKTGDANSLFGFSLAMHRQLRPAEKRMLLVGAPKARALSKQKSTITGGMYNCDINSPSQSCQRVMFDNEENLDTENKQNQWMGVTVQSQGPGGKILVCAHRYQRRMFVGLKQELRDITGRCYVLSEDLTISDASLEDGGEWMFCNGRNRGHERFGSCQQGLSATFTKDYHYLVFGAPGAYNWKGLVRMEQKNSSLWDQNIFDDGPYEVGDEGRLDADLVPVPANSYLGFSLDSGKMLTKRGQLTIVAGAPRANHSGAVVLLKKDDVKSSMLTAEYTLEGPGLASSFGYDLAVLDINGDGWQDIVVGAPQYFIKDGDIGGAIYVYLNKEGAWDKITPKRIDGAAYSMFGLAVENMGDVNLDGYHDVAVGAPYDSNGAGNVYIFHGSLKGLERAQVLGGKDHNVKLFGYSLAGNMDLDRNNYPDLAVGSLSDSVFVYRARSVISIEKTVTTTPKELDLTKKNCGDAVCLDVKACFKFSVKPITYNPTLRVKYTMKVESERKKLNLPSRVIFNPRSANEYESTGEVELKGQGTESCVTRGLRLQETLRDKMRGIPIEVSVEILNPSTRRKRQSALPNLLPILDANQDATSFTKVEFIKEGCGTDHICTSDLRLQYKFCSKEPNRNIFHPLPEEKGVPVLSLSDQKYIALEIKVQNKGEDAYEVQLSSSFPKSLSYSTIYTESVDKPVNCLANANGSQAECDIGNPFKKDAETTFYIILNTGGISLDTSEIEIDLKLLTTSNQTQLPLFKAKALVKIQLLLSLSGIAKPSQVYFTGEVKGESAMKLTTDVGSPIDYEFRVTNLGKPLKSFGTASMIIQWPKHNSQGKWLLYLMKMTPTGLESFSCTNQNEVNKLGLKEHSVPRTKREIEETPAKEGKTSFFIDKRKSTVLSCEDGAQCVTFICSLTGMDSNAVISLRAYLWNSTFLEEYEKFNYIDIIVKASLDFKSSAKNIDLKNEPAQVRVTVFPERKVAQYGGMPWWVILVAILLGLLLLGILVFLLWKCGFFGKSDKEPEKERLTSDA
ncbi:integrin alpha-6b isoform X2 [Carassius auratus]|uniref:Integrin alpha-6b isoform X2 n=1 Tax=Carassius auratus TaxID=7957 RepID=A0A6P6JKL2_CARAU|nr:integrin alpha-6-like isoform X2 [Carassius auratus]